MDWTWIFSGIGAFVMMLIFLFLYFIWRKSESKEGRTGRTIAKIGAIIFFFVFLVVAILPIMMGEVEEPGKKQVALACDLTLYEEASSDYDFTHTANDDDVATGVTEIVVDNELATVLVMVTVDDSANTVVPDGFSVQHDIMWVGGQDEMTYQDATAPGYVYARLENTDWPTHENNNSVQADWFDRDSYGTYSIAWTDSASKTVVGEADGGRVAVFSGTTMSATFYLSIYFDETTATTDSSAHATTMSWQSDVLLETKSENANAIGYWSTTYTIILQFTFQL